MSPEGFQPYTPQETNELKRSDRIPLPDQEVDAISENVPFPVYTIKDVKYVALPMQTFWEKFSEFPELHEEDMFLAGNKNHDLEVHDGSELTLNNEYNLSTASPEYAVILLPLESVKDTIQILDAD